MSLLTRIGFEEQSRDQLVELLQHLIPQSQVWNTYTEGEAFYRVYTDPSGAQLWIQFANEREGIGFIPHFNGKSRRWVRLESVLPDEDSQLAGSFYGWGQESEPSAGMSDSDIYPFIFEVPDFGAVPQVEVPRVVEIQLTAFALEMDVYESEEAYNRQQSPNGESDFLMAPRSFIPSGLFVGDSEAENLEMTEALGMFSGYVKEAEARVNTITGNRFCWMLVDTLGGEADVVAELHSDEHLPKSGGLISGHFWLSGRILP